MNIYREETVKAARKDHQCAGCLTQIYAGEGYLRITAQDDEGRPVTDAYHPNCRSWEVFLCREADLNSDEWTPLHEHVFECRDTLDGAPPDVIARFPVKSAPPHSALHDRQDDAGGGE